MESRDLDPQITVRDPHGEHDRRATPDEQQHLPERETDDEARPPNLGARLARIEHRRAPHEAGAAGDRGPPPWDSRHARSSARAFFVRSLLLASFPAMRSIV